MITGVALVISGYQGDFDAIAGCNCCAISTLCNTRHYHQRPQRRPNEAVTLSSGLSLTRSVCLFEYRQSQDFATGVHSIVLLSAKREYTGSVLNAFAGI